MPEANRPTKDTRRRLIHWAGTPQGACVRKDSKVDQAVKQQGETTITQTAEATHPENVTCKVCRKAERDSWPPITECDRRCD
jgi:hypothetical protein